MKIDLFKTIIVILLAGCAITLFKWVQIYERALNCNRFQFQNDGRIIFDTRTGALYTYEDKDVEKADKVILLQEPIITE